MLFLIKRNPNIDDYFPYENLSNNLINEKEEIALSPV